MPKVRCDWDCCKHYNLDTGYCDNPDEVKLTTVEALARVGTGKTRLEKTELFYCKSFESYEEGEG